MRTLLVLAVVVLAEGRAGPDACTVSEWGPWSDWVTANHDSTVESFPATEETGQGEVMREVMMEMMRRKFKGHQQRPTEGPVDCTDGFVSDIPCWNIDQLSFVSIDDFLFDPAIDPNPGGTDLWAWTDPLNGDEYSIMGLQTGTTFLRVTDPRAPVVVGHLATHGTELNAWRDIKVIGNYAFIVCELRDHGMQVFDLTRLRGVEGVTFTEDAHYAGFGNCHNIVANEDTGYLYAVGCTDSAYPLTCTGGLFVVNPADPLNPVYEGCFGGDGYVHDAECVTYTGPDVNYQDNEICFCYNEDTVTIVDVTDKANMVQLSRTGYGGAFYTHQGWLTEDMSIALVDDELDEYNSGDMVQKTYIWDVSNLNAPVLMNTYRSTELSADHNLYIKGDYNFQSNYESGFRILHIDQPTYTLTEVAYFDLSPDTGGASWSNYPYFASGNIAVAASHYGLFTLMPDWEAIEAQVAEQKTAYRTRSRNILELFDEAACPELEQVEYK